MITLTSTKILWISLLSIGLVSTILPTTEAAEKGAIGLVGHEHLHRPRMLRPDKKPPPEAKPKPGDNIEIEEVVEAVPNTVEVVPDTYPTITELGSNITNRPTAIDALSNETAVDALSNETMEDELLEEPVDVEVELMEDPVGVEEERLYSSNVASTIMTLENTWPLGLPFFTFTITTDPDTEEIDTSELGSLLSDYLLKELRDKLPESYLVQLDFDVDYKYKPEKKEVDGVGFAADNEDSVHIFTATGSVYVKNSSAERPTENQIFAKARDSMSKDDAEATILSLLQENKEPSLQEAKTFSVSEVKPREPTYLEADSHSISRTMDIFIGMTAVLTLLTGAYVARDKAMVMSDNQQEPQESFDDDEEESVVYKKKNVVVADEDEETLPPTPPTTPPATPSTTPTRKSQLITLSPLATPFTTFTRKSQLITSSPPITPSTTSTRKSQLVTLSPPVTPSTTSTQKSQLITLSPPVTPSTTSTRKSQLITLSDFNILDELSHLGGGGTNKGKGGNVNNVQSQQQPSQSILRSSSRQTKLPATYYKADETTAVSTQHSSPTLIALSDFNVLDELMCIGKELGQESTTEPSRHVKFDIETNTTNGDTSLPHMLDACGPIEMADGVKIDRAGMQSKKSGSTKGSSSGFGLFDCGVEDLNVFGIIDDDDDDDDHRSGTRSRRTSYSGATSYSYDDRSRASSYGDRSGASSYDDDSRSRFGSDDSDVSYEC